MEMCVKKHFLTCQLDYLAMNLFNELNKQDGLQVSKLPTQGKFVFTVEKQMKAMVKLVPCKYEILLYEDNSNCILEFKNLDEEPVAFKYIKAYFVLGGFKILSVYEELKAVKQFPEYVDSLVKCILKTQENA